MGATCTKCDNICETSCINHYKLFFDRSPEALCITRKNSNFYKVNKSFSDMLGYPIENFKNSYFLTHIYPDDLEDTFREMKRLNKGIKTISFKNRYIRSDNKVILIEWTSVNIGDFYYAIAHEVKKESEEI